MTERIVALYKTWDGGELIGASLASIYDSVDAIVMVHADTSWLGELGNTARAEALRWCGWNDRDNKVHHVDTSKSKQEEQYAVGLEYLERYNLGDIIMVVDADEIWETKYIENAIRRMHDHPHPAYRCKMHTYLKSPFFRVSPATGNPTVFLRDGSLLTKSPRACRANGVVLGDVWMHHYTYVRATRAAVERKLYQSAKADGNENVVDGWMETVYDQLPEGRDLHAFERWRSMWKQVRKVWIPDVPEALRHDQIMDLWMPPGELLDGEMAALHRLSFGRRQAVDLGTHYGRSAAVLSLACERTHTVDCYEDLPEGTFADTLDPQRYEKPAWRDHNIEDTQELALRLGNLTCEQALTSFAGHHWDRGPVDVLFIDADHSEYGVLNDAASWIPHLRPGARIILHDNNDIHPGVQSAIRYMLGHWPVKEIDPGEWSGSIFACEVK